MAEFDVITVGLHELEATFGRIATGGLKAVDTVVADSALRIKNDAVRRISGHRHAPAYPKSITYDLFHTPYTSQAEIGPDKKRRQGALGNILEYGTVNNAPIPHLHPALDAEIPHLERGISDAIAAMWAEP